MVNLEKKNSEKPNHFKKVLVTSALPYVNNLPHLGTMICVISADVYTKFLRLKNVDVTSVLGTDEHGTTSETKAIEEGLTTKELCDKYYALQKDVYEWFCCDFDCFGRTSSKENSEITIDIFNKLYANGYIQKDSLEQLFCEKCQRFLADRFVEGTCPKCNYENARGDQCESCGNLLNAHELIKPKCKLCKTTPIIRQSDHLFIDLPKIESRLREWIGSVESGWSDNARTMTQAWLREGLRKRCITRDLKWGIKVPLKGYENKVFYSWFDAPIGYIGITAENKDDWRNLWHNPKEVKLVQFMGKDNIPFHTILFPSFLIGTNDNYTLLNELSVNEFLNYEGTQFSKSRNVGIFGDDAKSTRISPDVFRYYLMMNRPEKSDADFSWDDFQKKNNSEIVANIGNLVNRTITFLNRFYDSKVPEAELNDKDKLFLKEVKIIEENINKLLESINIKEALKEIMHISRLGNQYLQENEPWKNTDEMRKSTCLNLLVNLVKDLSVLIFPYMPLASKNIQKQLNCSNLDWSDLGKLSLHAGHKINTAELLFKKIEDKEIAGFRERFAGKSESKENSINKSVGVPFDKVQLRVAKILDVKKHPSAEKLYIEELDFGDEKRTIVSGLVPHYTAEELIGKNIIVVTNLEPANLRGVESNGMLLAAEENKIVGLLLTDAEPGEYVYTSKLDSDKISQLKSLPMINIKEFSTVKISVKNGKVFADDKELQTETKPIFVDKNIQNGSVR